MSLSIDGHISKIIQSKSRIHSAILTVMPSNSTKHAKIHMQLLRHKKVKPYATTLSPMTIIKPKLPPPPTVISPKSSSNSQNKNKRIKLIMNENSDTKPWPPIRIPPKRGTGQILILDAFTFNFELDLLEIRLNELKSVVDYHILVESAHDLYGNPKPMHFHLHKWEKRFLKFRDKIIHVPIREWVENNTGCKLGFMHLDRMRRKIVSPGLDMIVSNFSTGIFTYIYLYLTKFVLSTFYIHTNSSIFIMINITTRDSL